MEAPRITAISLQRTPCFGPCPIDRVTLRCDGTATYEGKQFVERIGLYEGQIWVGRFRRLVELVEYVNFFGLDDQYPDPLRVEDLPSRVTTVIRDGVAKTVRTTDVSFVFEGVSYPVGLWALEMAILAMSAEMTWKESPPGKPKTGREDAGPMWDEQLDR